VTVAAAPGAIPGDNSSDSLSTIPCRAAGVDWMSESLLGSRRWPRPTDKREVSGSTPLRPIKPRITQKSVMDADLHRVRICAQRRLSA
jgi:hypothetical protein